MRRRLQVATRVLGLVSVSAAAIAVTATAASAQSAGEFYKGKRLRLIVGGSAGGGYDTYARAFARHYVKHIPGKPGVVVQNMQGAGGVRAANFLASAATPKDGTVFGTTLRTVGTVPLLDPKGGAQYDANKFNWLGSLANETSICVSWHTSPVKTFKDALGKELIVGASSGNDTEIYPAVFNNLLGTKFKIVTGYEAVGINIAMERGEVAGRCAWSWTSLMTQRPDWLRQKKINILAVAASERPPEVPADVPLVMDFAGSDADRGLLEIFFLPQVMGRPYFLPAGVPADRVAAMRAAFDRTVREPKLAADFKKAKLELSPVSGEAIQKMLARVYAAPKEVISRAREAMQYRGEKAVLKTISVTARGTVLRSNREGRELEFKLSDGTTGKTSVSTSGTRVTIGGKPAKRADIRMGMACEIEWPGPGQQAQSLACK